MTSNATDPSSDAAQIDPAWGAEFEAVRRRPLALRWRHASIQTCKPVLDEPRRRP